MDAAGRVMREVGRTDPRAGPDVQLTLDHRLQNSMRHRMEGSSGAIVVVGLETGDLLGCVSAPLFDPNLFARRVSTEDYARLRDDERRPLADKSVQGAYPPGPTIKLSIAVAAAGGGRGGPVGNGLVRWLDDRRRAPLPHAGSGAAMAG